MKIIEIDIETNKNYKKTVFKNMNPKTMSFERTSNCIKQQMHSLQISCG